MPYHMLVHAAWLTLATSYLPCNGLVFAGRIMCYDLFIKENAFSPYLVHMRGGSEILTRLLVKKVHGKIVVLLLTGGGSIWKRY